MTISLSKTIDQAYLDQSLTPLQQASLYRIKERLLYIDDEHMDILLNNMLSMDKECIDATLCRIDFIYFCNEYCFIKDTRIERWMQFRLWPIQEQMAERVLHSKQRYRLVVPKSRQIGVSWEFGGVLPLWFAFFRPNIEILIYSLRERDAIRLLSEERMGGIIKRIPSFVTHPTKFLSQHGKSNRRKSVFSNGSVIYSLNPREGDGYSAKYAFIDEADFFENLSHTLSIVEPATEHGKLIIASRCNKYNGDSTFKKLCRSAAYYPEDTEYDFCFVPWYAPPNRTQDFYDELAKGNDIDFMHSNYPATLEEALAPAQLNKRIPTEDLSRCLGNADVIKTMKIGHVRHPNLKVYRKPSMARKYYIGVDTAEGLEHSDNSAIVVVDDRGEDVANIVGKISPAYQAALTRDLSKVYNNARILVEANFHGSHTIGWLEENGCRHLLLRGANGRKVGWTTTQQSKASLYINLAELVLNEELIINDRAIFDEVQNISKNTLSAPRGHYDDRAMAFALAQMARTMGRRMPTLRIIDLTWD